MKKILFLSLFLMCASAGFAQTFNVKPALSSSSSQGVARSTYGTYVAIGYVLGNNCTIIANTVTPTVSNHPDTLFSPAVSYWGYASDSGYSQFVYHSKVDKTFDLAVTAITGTLAGKAVLQGSYDNATWYNIIGDTSHCSACIGVKATLSGSGTTHYQWFVPGGAENYSYHQAAPILSGTCTATFTTTMNVSY